MAKPIFKRGETRAIRLVNGTQVTGFHTAMERRWEVVRIYTDNGTFHGCFSRTTGFITPKSDLSTILAEDPGFEGCYLIDKR